jgi:L-malate glycosyltransferase
MNKHVLIIQRRMTEYRIPMFEALRDKLSDKGIDLTVAWGTPAAEEVARQDEAELSPGIRLPTRYFGVGTVRLIWHSLPRQMVSESDLVIMPHENSMLSNYRFLLHRGHKSERLAFWGHGANLQANGGGIVRSKIKSWMTSKVDWYFAYTALSVDKLRQAGFPSNRITCLNNAIDTEQLVEWKTGISSLEKKALLKELGLTGGHLGIFIGSLHKDKRLDFLFSAADHLRDKFPDFELPIIGDGPLRGEIKRFVEFRKWANWVGAKHGREKVLYASLGQVMLNPGMVGLGILDSFAMGIPMVTTDCGIHSPEISYLETGRNGFMVPDTEDDFVRCVSELFEDQDLLGRMKSNCQDDAQKYTIDKMADNFCEGIIRALDS